MKTLHLSLITIFVILCNNSIVYAQYGSEGGNPVHQRILQEQIDLGKAQLVKQQAEETQIFSMLEVGIPIAVGISVGMLLFTRKRK